MTVSILFRDDPEFNLLIAELEQHIENNCYIQFNKHKSKEERHAKICYRSE